MVATSCLLVPSILCCPCRVPCRGRTQLTDAVGAFSFALQFQIPNSQFPHATCHFTHSRAFFLFWPAKRTTTRTQQTNRRKPRSIIQAPIKRAGLAGSACVVSLARYGPNALGRLEQSRELDQEEKKQTGNWIGPLPPPLVCTLIMGRGGERVSFLDSIVYKCTDEYQVNTNPFFLYIYIVPTRWEGPCFFLGNGRRRGLRRGSRGVGLGTP